MANQQGVRRLVLLIMISSPVPTWNSSGLVKVLRIRSTHIRASLDELIDMDWIRQVDDRDGFWWFLKPPAYRVTTLGYADGIADLVRHRVSSRKVADSSRPSWDSLTNLLPITGDVALPDRHPTGRSLDLQAPKTFALCTTNPDGATDAVAWGLQFAQCVVLTSYHGEPLGRLPDPHSARKRLAQRLGIPVSSLHIVWTTPRKQARPKPPPTTRPGQLSGVR
jgi:hypothetical protein